MIYVEFQRPGESGQIYVGGTGSCESLIDEDAGPPRLPTYLPRYLTLRQLGKPYGKPVVPFDQLKNASMDKELPYSPKVKSRVSE